MIGTAIRLYRAEHNLTQTELGARVFLSQTMVSRLEIEEPVIMNQLKTDPDRFSPLTDLIKVQIQKHPIHLYKSSAFPDLGCLDRAWIAFVSDSSKDDCARLFAGMDVAIVVQD